MVPRASALAIDLMEKMLQFLPENRYFHFFSPFFCENRILDKYFLNFQNYCCESTGASFLYKFDISNRISTRWRHVWWIRLGTGSWSQTKRIWFLIWKRFWNYWWSPNENFVLQKHHASWTIELLEMIKTVGTKKVNWLVQKNCWNQKNQLMGPKINSGNLFSECCYFFSKIFRCGY